MNSEIARAQRFRGLHTTGCFAMPNPWDVGSAVYLARLGCKALATTSAGFAHSLGRPDLPTALPLDDVLQHVRAIAGATALPLNVDFQDGYATEPHGVHANVGACLRAGAAGLSIEDSTGDEAAPLFELPLAIERVRAAAAARDATLPGAVLTARCEAWLVGDRDPLRTALDRLIAFADAGADCLYAPGVRDPKHIGALVAAVAPKPVNVLVSRPGAGLSVAALAALGVRRISLGSALARVAWDAFRIAAHELVEHGTFEGLADRGGFADLDSVFGAAGRQPPAGSDSSSTSAR